MKTNQPLIARLTLASILKDQLIQNDQLGSEKMGKKL